MRIRNFIYRQTDLSVYGKMEQTQNHTQQLDTKLLFNPEIAKNAKTNHTTEIPVLWSQLDANGHVNNGTYQFYLDEARMQALEEEGFSISLMRESNIGPVIQKVEIKYSKPVQHPETVLIETTFSEIKGFRGKVHQTIRRKSDNEKVCEATFDALFFDFTKNRPWKLPEVIRNKYTN